MGPHDDTIRIASLDMAKDELMEKLRLSIQGHAVCRSEHKKRCKELADVTGRAQGYRNEASRLTRELEQANGLLDEVHEWNHATALHGRVTLNRILAKRKAQS